VTRGRARRAALVVAALAIACSRRPEGEGARPGRRVAEGPVAALRAAPDGAHVAWLTACAPVAQRPVPRGTRSCELRVAPLAGGAAAVVAAGVSSAPGGFAWAPGGALVALADLDPASGAGALVRWAPGGAASRLGEGVTFHAAGPDGRIGFVARGQLVLAAPGAAPAPVPGATRIATFEFAPAGGAGAPAALARRESRAGGDLLAVGAGGVRTVATRAGDYRVSARGDVAFTAGEPGGESLALARLGPRAEVQALRRNVQRFAFDASGAAVAFLADLAPGRQGDLWIAAIPAAGAPPAPRRIAEGVGEFRWAAAAPRLAWLTDYDPGTRSGTLAVGGPGEPAVTLGRRVSAWDLAPDGSRIAWLEHVVQGGYSVDLKLAQLGAGAPRVEDVARGVFGFELSQAEGLLYYRAGCTRNGEVCDLYRVAATGVAGAAPERLAGGVRSFELDPRRPGRLLLTWARAQGEGVDVGVWEQGKVVRIDGPALAGSAALLPGDAPRVVYAIVEEGREGVYVAEVR
jgi:hypothetical protein